MNTEEQDDLWRLLGKAGTPSISPFFSRNVVRAARESGQEKIGVVTWLRSLHSRWAIVAVGACAVLVSGFVLILRPAPQSEKQINLLAQQFSTSPDYQVVNHLDELLDSEKDSVWLEN